MSVMWVSEGGGSKMAALSAPALQIERSRWKQLGVFGDFIPLLNGSHSFVP